MGCSEERGSKSGDTAHLRRLTKLRNRVLSCAERTRIKLRAKRTDRFSDQHRRGIFVRKKARQGVIRSGFRGVVQKMNFMVSLFILSAAAGATGPEPISEVEFNPFGQYRLVISVADGSPPLTIDLRWLQKASGTLGPFGARIFIEDHSGNPISCLGSEGKGYSSTQHSSNIRAMQPARSLELQPGETHRSPWYHLESLLWGFPDCALPSWDPENLARYKIRFRVGSERGVILAESDWRAFDSFVIGRIR